MAKPTASDNTYLKTLVVGGLRKHVLDTLAIKLARYSLGVVWHWPMDKSMDNTIPVDCEVVILLEDMARNASDLRKTLKKQTSKMGIRFVGTRSSSASLNASLLKEKFTQLEYTAPAAAAAAAPAVAQPPVRRRDGVIAPFTPTGAMPVVTRALNPDELPLWLRSAMETGAPVDLLPDREVELFELAKTRTFTISVNVTAALAERWVDAQTGRNTRNRSLIQRKADQLTRAFKRGEYRKSHQGLAFGRDGSLQDGQHRLWAVWFSEQPVAFDFLVTFGQVEEVIPIIDDVTKRTVGANRQIRTGDAQSKRKVEAVTIIHHLLSGTSGSVYPPSYDECESYITMFKDGVEWAATLPKKARVNPASVRGALAFAYASGPEKVKEFAEQVIEGIGLRKGQPAHTLRLYLESSRSAGSSSIRREIAVKALRACLAHLSGDDLPKLYATEEAVSFFAKAHGLTLDGSGYRLPVPGDLTAGEAAAKRAEAK